MDIEEFTDLANEILDREIPEIFLKDLNQGISIVPEKMEEEGYYIMGEYIVNELGNLIVLYYGSFVESLEEESRELWVEEIRSTLKHEIWHHVESLAGEEKLAYQEELENWED